MFLNFFYILVTFILMTCNKHDLFFEFFKILYRNNLQKFKKINKFPEIISSIVLTIFNLKLTILSYLIFKYNDERSLTRF